MRPGDILVGKVSPKSKTELTPEEKLLHAIFGRAGEDVKNDSLEVPSGIEGIVIDTQKFSPPHEPVGRRAQEVREGAEGGRDRRQQARSPQVFGAMVDEMEKVLGKTLDRRGRHAAGRATRTPSSSPRRPRNFKLDSSTSAAPQRSKIADVEKLYKHACGRPSKRRSTTATASSTA